MMFIFTNLKYIYLHIPQAVNIISHVLNKIKYFLGNQKTKKYVYIVLPRG